MRRFILPLAALAVLSACGGDSMGAATPAPAPAARAASDFTSFVLDLLKSPSDTAEPVAVSAAQFVFRDEDNPAAFATALGGT